MYTYNWLTLLHTWNEHNIVNQLYSNKIFFKKQKDARDEKTVKYWLWQNLKLQRQEFPWRSSVKTSPSNAGGAGFISG